MASVAAAPVSTEIPPARWEQAPTRRPWGAGFVCPSGVHFEAHHPADSPELWAAYLDGATTRYRYHGVVSAFGCSTVEDGRTTSLFWLARDAGTAVAGLRCQGPLPSSHSAHALEELAVHPRLAEIKAAIDARVPYGVVEIKGVWVARGRHDNEVLADALARCFVHSIDWFDARFALCTAATHAVPRWETSGGRAAEGLEPVPYPDDRYQTVLLWWDRELVGERATADQIDCIEREAAELRRAPTRRRSRSVRSLEVMALNARRDDIQQRPGAEAAAVLLNPHDQSDAQVVSDLQADPAVIVVDSYEDQHAELLRLRPPAGPDLLDEPPTWIYYAWRRCLTRVVGPRSFQRLRLDRNRNKITLDEQRALSRLRIGVVGLSVGHVIAHTLALEGLCGELRLADFDRIELSNLNRIPVSVLDIGTNKAIVAARRIAELDPYLAISVFEDGISPDRLDEFLDGLDVLIEECDSLDVKLLVREAARRRGIPVLMETSDRGMLDVERFDVEPHRALFHGLVDDLRAADVHDLNTHNKVPAVLRILEPAELSARMAASMAEIDETVTTWPQLGGDVTLGAATVAAAVRRLGRREPLPSGRVRIDLNDCIDQLATPAATNLVVDVPPPPRSTPAPDLVRLVAHAASLAPSGGNTQPWGFEGDDTHLEFHLVRDRTSTMDVGFRGSYVALGAALFNARIAASSQARLGPVELFPNPADLDHVATLRFGEEIDLELAELSPRMLTRNTNRREGTPGPIETPTAERLRREAKREGGQLHVLVSRRAIDAYAELLAASDRLRYLSPRLHRELMSELRWPGHDALDTGIDVRTLELDSSDVAKLAVARRADVMAQLASWNAGRALGDISRERVRSSSGIAIVTVEGSDPASYVRGGAVLERVWLTAEDEGLAVQPVSPVFVFAREHDELAGLVSPAFAPELDALFEQFSSLAGLRDEESVVLVLRLSHAEDASQRSMRLPLDDVLRVTAHPHLEDAVALR